MPVYRRTRFRCYAPHGASGHGRYCVPRGRDNFAVDVVISSYGGCASDRPGPTFPPPTCPSGAGSVGRPVVLLSQPSRRPLPDGITALYRRLPRPPPSSPCRNPAAILLGPPLPRRSWTSTSTSPLGRSIRAPWSRASPPRSSSRPPLRYSSLLRLRRFGSSKILLPSSQVLSPTTRGFLRVRSHPLLI